VVRTPVALPEVREDATVVLPVRDVVREDAVRVDVVRAWVAFAVLVPCAVFFCELPTQWLVA